MEKEISNATTLGIVLIALAVIIGLGFAIFAISKGTANEGVTDVQSNLSTIKDSDFDPYDQTVITGTQLKSAYKNFEGKNAAILIATANFTDVAKGATTSVSGQQGIPTDGTYTAAAITDSTTTNPVLKPAATGIKAKGSTGTSYDAVFVNYNMLIDCTSSNALTMAGGAFKTAGGVANKNGAPVFNNAVKRLSTSGCCEFLAPSSKFNCYLLKDSTGTNIGLVAIQIVN